MSIQSLYGPQAANVTFVYVPETQTFEDILVTDTQGKDLYPDYETLKNCSLCIEYDDIGPEIISDGMSTSMHSEKAYKSSIDGDREAAILNELQENGEFPEFWDALRSLQAARLTAP